MRQADRYWRQQLRDEERVRTAQRRAEREAELLEALRRIRLYTDRSGAAPHDAFDFALSGLRRAIDKAADVITGVEGYFLYRQHSVMGRGTRRGGGGR